MLKCGGFATARNPRQMWQSLPKYLCMYVLRVGTYLDR
jgi:hypothetical protein